MKRFTKGALITVLVFAILGFTLCAVGAGIGFHYTSIPKMISDGVFSIRNSVDNWSGAWSWTEFYDFSKEECADIQNLTLQIEGGIVEIEEAGENDGIHVEVKYRKENSNRDIDVNLNGNTLKIEENGFKKLWNNENVRVLIQIPSDMEWGEVVLDNSAGEITVNHALRAENISIMAGAGKGEINKELQVSGTLYAEVDAGEIDFVKVNAGKIELHAGVGEIDVEKAGADEVILECGVGELNVTLEGREEDYSYQIDCGIGEVEIADRSYSGLGTTKEVKKGDKTVDIDCGVGEINVDFTK